MAIINKAAMNIVKHVSLLHVGASSRYMPRSGIAVSYSRTTSNFLKNHQTDFQSGCTSLQSDQQWRSVPFSTSLPAFAVTCIIDLSHSDRCKMNSQSSFDLHFPDD